jgi:hypothetical protein
MTKSPLQPKAETGWNLNNMGPVENGWINQYRTPGRGQCTTLGE